MEWGVGGTCMYDTRWTVSRIAHTPLQVAVAAPPDHRGAAALIRALMDHAEADRWPQPPIVVRTIPSRINIAHLPGRTAG